MKKLLIVALITIATGPVIIDPVWAAENEETFCRTSSDIADAGFELKISSDQQTAVLLEQSIAGPRLVAELVCQRLNYKSHPDSLNNYLICKDPRNIEGGLLVRVYRGGIAGLHIASVREASRIGNQSKEMELEFGRLNCR